MKLTDNEIRDITWHLEAGKPQPDKYRFLLFDEKRQVELDWNGKIADVCNVVMPFQIIEPEDEPRAEKPEVSATWYQLRDETKSETTSLGIAIQFLSERPGKCNSSGSPLSCVRIE